MGLDLSICCVTYVAGAVVYQISNFKWMFQFGVDIFTKSSFAVLHRARQERSVCSRCLVCTGDWIAELVVGHQLADWRQFFYFLGWRCWVFFSHQVVSGHDFHLHVVFVAVAVASLHSLDAVQNFSSTQQPSSQDLILNEASILNRCFIAQSQCMGKQSSVVMLRYGCRKWFNAYIHQRVIKEFIQD